MNLVNSTERICPRGRIRDVVTEPPVTVRDDAPPQFLPIPTSEIDDSRHDLRPDSRHDVVVDTHIERPRDALDEFVASPLRSEDASDGPGMSSTPVDGGQSRA